MNRFVFGRGWVFCDETNGTDANGAAGGAAAVDDKPAGEGDGEGDGADPDLDAGGEGAGAAAAPGAKKEEAPKDMKTAIDAALGYKKGPGGEAIDPLTGKLKEEKPAAKPGDKKPDVAAEKHANGAPKKNAGGDELDDKGQVTKKAEAPKAKTSTELQLSKEQLAVLKPEARQRFQDVMTTLKTHEGTIAKQSETIKGLSEARDAIVSVLQETKTTNEQFVNLVTFNGLLQSGDPKKLREALKMVEDQRLAIYTSLGIEPEGGGIDLLADFPDLKKQVEDAEITRAAALEIAQGRRERQERAQAAHGRQQQQHQQNQTEAQWKADGEAAETEIKKWIAELVASDIDYKAKEDKLMADIDDVLKDYAPKMWLPTLKLLYKGIVIQKAAGGSKQINPLRPTGARPGARAPGDMLEAINQGLGYATPAKG